MNGATRRYRADLSGVSSRCFHLISLSSIVGERVPDRTTPREGRALQAPCSNQLLYPPIVYRPVSMFPLGQCGEKEKARRVKPGGPSQKLFERD